MLVRDDAVYGRPAAADGIDRCLTTLA